MSQVEMFGNKPAKTVIWDGKTMQIDEAIKLVKLQIKLAPSFARYKLALDYLLELKDEKTSKHYSPIQA